MERIFLFLFAIITTNSLATNYYVSPAGDDNNNGLTISTAFLTINVASYAVSAGDTVFIMTGIYTENNPESLIAFLTVSGTEGNPITFKAFPNETPILQMNSNNWGAFGINGCDYIIIDGLTIIGNNDNITLQYAQEQQLNTNNPSTSGSGIAIDREYNNEINKPHHIIIRNCIISKCGGGGIYTYNADYITIENNTISECAWYAPYGNSGISIYQNWNSDNFTGIKNFITGNTCYRNENFIPWFVAGSITDGNGIIIDDGRNTQNGSTLGIYNGTTYVANNLVFDNGARGIHCYESDNVIVVNNTVYQNCKSPSTQQGELTAFDATNITYLNNIVSPSDGIPPIFAYDQTTSNITSQYNLITNNASLANPVGINNIVGTANFVAASSNFTLADFHIQASSLAINAGTTSNAPLLDKDQNNRLSNGFIDIGCYEFQSPLSITDLENSKIKVFPNPVSNFLFIENYEMNDVIKISNSIGQLVYSKNNSTNKIDFSNFQAGIYFLKLDNNTFKIIKK